MPHRNSNDEIGWLERELEAARAAGIDDEELLALLGRIARLATPGDATWISAFRQLAELGVEHDPWRAALYARKVLTYLPQDDAAWAVMGLAQSLLRNYRYAAFAYERALQTAPDNPFYLHNLGHLYDVALDRPRDALPLLSRALEVKRDEADIAASYAHALARCGKRALAKRILARAIRHGATADQKELFRWLEAGAPGARASTSRQVKRKKRPKQKE